jgi:hypothetical protein
MMRLGCNGPSERMFLTSGRCRNPKTKSIIQVIDWYIHICL